jgi:hypothetical protein
MADPDLEIARIAKMASDHKAPFRDNDATLAVQQMGEAVQKSLH